MVFRAVFMWQSAYVGGVERRRGTYWLPSVRHPARRDGVIALVLFFLPGVAALLLEHRDRRLDSGTIGLLISIALGLPVLWLTWASVRVASRSDVSADSLDLAEIADQLARAVGSQWEAEAAIRRLNDPYPLPVSWVAADESLADPWDSLVTLADGGAGWPLRPSAGTWATGPNDLAGLGNELVDVLTRIPTGRLVVLGEPGAGKTMLMVRLVLDLLARRPRGGPVPVLVSVASWAPASDNLHGWLAARLSIDYPALASPAPRDDSSRITALLTSGLIMPVLDGLDEMPAGLRGPAIARINEALRPGERLVLTCRAHEYEQAIRPPDGIEVTVRAAGVIRLCQLEPEAISTYLTADAGGPVMAARWAPVLSVLGTAAPAGQALSTPLMVGLARAIYNPRPGEHAGELPDPATLCGQALEDRAAVESHLFDAYIPAAYRSGPGNRWTARNAERWLIFLARHLEYTANSPDLAWWQLYESVSPVSFGVVPGLLAGIAAGLAFGIPLGVKSGLLFGFSFCLLLACLTVLLTNAEWWRRRPPARGVRWRWGRDWLHLWSLAFRLTAKVGRLFPFAPYRVLKIWVVLLRSAWDPTFRMPRIGVAGIPMVAALGLMTIGMVGTIGLTGGLAFFLGFTLAIRVVMVFTFNSESAPLDLGQAGTPREVLVRDRRATLVLSAWFGLAAGLVVALLALLVTTPKHMHGFLPGLAFGIALGLMLGMIFLAVHGLIYVFSVRWPHFELARAWLALRGRVPWSLLLFLADAHRRGVLRQTGAVYQFRHIALQRRLAARPPGKYVGHRSAGQEP